LLAKIKKPQDISSAHLKALNLKVNCDIGISSIVPGDVQSSVPPYLWGESSHTPEQDASGAETMPVPTLMSNGNPFPTKEKYSLLRGEILVDNEDAFRAVARMAPLPGHKNVKITQSRKFFSGLDHIGQYWDSTLDCYIEHPPAIESPQAENPPPDQMHIDNHQGPEKTTENLPSEDKMEINEEQGDMATPKREDSEKNGGSERRITYKGRRIGTGREMPEEMREETLRGLVEMVAWPFGCQVSIPSLPPRLLIKSLLFPVRQTFTVSRSPQDRQIARKGILEGPMLLVQCRGETIFHDDGEGVGSRYQEICDLLRETAAMLLFAQERARDGVPEVKPGDGKWWATRPRWGGAPNQGTGGDDDNNRNRKDDDNDNDGFNMRTAAKRSKFDRHSLPLKRSMANQPRKLTMAEKWNIIQPGPSLWDRKMRYMQIGKDKNSPFDDVRAQTSRFLS
jgi:hypothetical protein